MRLRIWLTIASVATVGGVTAGLVMASSGSPKTEATAAQKGFHPKQIAGKWRGTWTNTTFGSKGSIRANVRSRGKQMRTLVDFGGFVFGCAEPDAEVAVLRRGKGPNRWNGRGFRVSQETEAFGKIDLVYRHAKNVFRGSGEAPPCAPNLSYTLRGKLTKDAFNARVNIKSGGASVAQTRLRARKR